MDKGGPEPRMNAVEINAFRTESILKENKRSTLNENFRLNPKNL